MRLRKIEFMEQNNWVEYKINVGARLKEFCLEILKFGNLLPEKVQTRVIRYQLTKSGTSMYANYRAAMRARSKAEFFSKLCIAVEEADETEMWLDLLIDSNTCTDDFIKTLHSESLELVKILASMRKKLS